MVFFGLCLLVPVAYAQPSSGREVVVAIVDDGIWLDHPALADFIWYNPREVPNNRIDDDRNGLVDDAVGWDFADGDADPSPPTDRIGFDHGTHLAGLIRRYTQMALGSEEHRVRLMPVKVLSDRSEDLALSQAYAGVEYAARQGAAVILMAWSDLTITEEEAAILTAASARGALLVAAAGNLGTEQVMYPAGHQDVLAIASLDGEQRALLSNYGGFVDIAAPGTDVQSLTTGDATALVSRSGTSPAAALVASAAAVAMAQATAPGPRFTRACLLASATPHTQLQEFERGRLGAGRLDISSSRECVLGQLPSISRTTAPKGYLFLNTNAAQEGVLLEPEGDFERITLTPDVPIGSGSSAAVDVREAQSGRRLYAGQIADMPAITNAVTGLRIQWQQVDPPSSPPGPMLTFRAEPTSLRNRFCTQSYERNTPVKLEDGSGAQEYAIGSDCRWLVRAPAGEHLRFTFEFLDTEPRTDLVYLFAGNGTHAPIIAVISGTDVPEAIDAPISEALVWFVSDLKNQGQGFRLTVEAIAADET